MGDSPGDEATRCAVAVLGAQCIEAAHVTLMSLLLVISDSRRSTVMTRYNSVTRSASIGFVSFL